MTEYNWERTSVTINNELHKRFKKWCKKNKRSMSEQATAIIYMFLEEEKKA